MARVFACLLAASSVSASGLAQTGPPSAAAEAAATPLPAPSLHVIPGSARVSTLTLASQPEWVVVAGAENLVDSYSWHCVQGVTVTDGELVIRAAEGYVTLANEFGPHLEVSGDFGVSATIENATTDWAGITLYGALWQEEWWRGIKRLDVGTESGTVRVDMYDGTGTEPVLWQHFQAAGLGTRVQLGVRKIGQTITILVDGNPVGQVGDPGLFASGVVYFGADVAPFNQLTVYRLSAEARYGLGVAVGEGRWAATPAGIATSLRSLAERRGLLIGAAVFPEGFIDEEPYAATLGRHFSLLTPENVMKLSSLQEIRGQYDFCQADLIVSFAKANHMQVRGHNLVWHEALPDWLTSRSYTREELITILSDHIRTLVGRYRGQIHAWDVVNEGIDNDGRLLNTIWLRGIGPDYIDLAFRWAHEADPAALLFYNDLGGEGLGTKSDGIYRLLAGLKQRGVPVHGVGLEMHVELNDSPPPAQVAANMRRLGDLGLIVHITEMDVSIGGTATPARLEAQARIYRDMLCTCLSAPNCKAFALWGFTDKHSWIPRHHSHPDAALIFDENYQPKPAYYALSGALDGTLHLAFLPVATWH